MLSTGTSGAGVQVSPALLVGTGQPLSLTVVVAVKHAVVVVVTTSQPVRQVGHTPTLVTT